jgi:hypothetical protein
MEELEDIRAFDEAEPSAETPRPFDQAVAEIKRSRKRAVACVILPRALRELSNLPAQRFRAAEVKIRVLQENPCRIEEIEEQPRLARFASAITGSFTKSMTAKRSFLLLRLGIAARFTDKLTFRSFLSLRW